MAALQIATLADLPEGSAKHVNVGGAAIALFRVDNALYALDDTCSHADAALSQGEVDVEEGCVACPLHGALFDLRTGQPRSLPAVVPVRTYTVWAEGNIVFLELP